MQIQLSQNIKNYRKKRGLTQEQLSQVLGVTAGAVHKWESGLSVPDLSLIVEMADFFDTSVDELLGYQMKDNRIESILERLDAYCRSGDTAALSEAEKALEKYPNSFKIVYHCADVYLIFGAAGHDRRQLRRALELLVRSLSLISQNEDPKISEMTIYGQIGNVYIFLDEKEKGLEILKAHNSAGRFSDAIGICLALDLNRIEEAEVYLSEALHQSVWTMINAILGKVIVFRARGDYASIFEITSLARNLLLGLKEGEQPDFTDKVLAALLVVMAYAKQKLENYEEAAHYLSQTAEYVHAFDRAPDYYAGNMRFISLPLSENLHDSLGSTAAQSVENILAMLDDAKLNMMWQEAVAHV